MTLATFRATASAANLSVYAVYALPYGGWAELHYSIETVEVMAADTLHSEMAPELIFGEVLERQLVEDLQTAVVIAKTADGHIVGGWSEAGWFLGSRAVTIDAAYGRVYAP